MAALADNHNQNRSRLLRAESALERLVKAMMLGGEEVRALAARVRPLLPHVRRMCVLDAVRCARCVM